MNSSNSPRIAGGLPVRDILPDGTLAPAWARSVYYPLLYVQSAEASRQQLLGIGMMSDPIRKAAMDAAIAARKVVATPQIELLTYHEPGILLVAPVFKKDAIEGFVLSVVPLQRLITEAIEPLTKTGVNIIAYDVQAGDDASPPLFIHTSRLLPSPDEEAMAIYRSSALRHEAVLAAADSAMYRAKQDKSVPYLYYLKPDA